MKNPDRSTESYPGERSSSTYLVLGACTRFHRNRGNSSRGRNSCPREFSARSSTSTRCPPRCPTCPMKKENKKNSVSDQRDTRYISSDSTTFATHFCCNLTSPRRHSTVGRGIPTARQAILTSTLQGTTSGTPNDIIAAGTN